MVTYYERYDKADRVTYPELHIQRVTIEMKKLFSPFYKGMQHLQAGRCRFDNWNLENKQTTTTRKKATCNKTALLTFTVLLAISADDKLIIFFLILPRKRNLTFMQIVSNNLHKKSKPFFVCVWVGRGEGGGGGGSGVGEGGVGVG